MIALLRIAVRNVWRNQRRSAVTIAAIALGAAALISFGQFVAQTVLNFQTGVVRNSGHLAIFKRGYSDFGAGNPGAYGITDFPEMINHIRSDKELGPRVAVITPTIRLLGVAGNFERDLSTTVSIVGVLPADFDRMRAWDDYGVRRGQAALGSGLDDVDWTHGVVGMGVARLLGLCRQLAVKDCADAPTAVLPQPETEAVAPEYLQNLAGGLTQTPGAGTRPELDILGASVSGAPNVVKLMVANAELQGVKELDDTYVRMHFGQAQQLLFDQDQTTATAVVLQLRQTSMTTDSKRALAAMLRKNGNQFELKDFEAMNPFYVQSVGFLSSIFAFLVTIIGVIVLFTVVNTMSMAVLERTVEIGTARALGARRSWVRQQFLAEGLVLGLTGASLGLVLVVAITLAVNLSGMKVLLPGTSDPVGLKLYASSEILPLVFAVWLGLVFVAVLAAIIPANRAAKLPIVDALRHV